MRKLETMFDLQDALQRRLGTWDRINAMGETGRQQFTNQMILALIEESIEIMRETPYKNPAYMPFGWKKGQPYNKEAMLGEIVDLWHFVMNLCLAHGFTAEQFYEKYCEKNNINFVRQDNGY